MRNESNDDHHLALSRLMLIAPVRVLRPVQPTHFRWNSILMSTKPLDWCPFSATMGPSGRAWKLAPKYKSDLSSTCSYIQAGNYSKVIIRSASKSATSWDCCSEFRSRVFNFVCTVHSTCISRPPRLLSWACLATMKAITPDGTSKSQQAPMPSLAPWCNSCRLVAYF
jgi:hypothetical protein